VARRSDHVPSWRFVFRENTAERQHDDVQILPFDIAACVGYGTRLKSANV
jgi:hypothetical protein